MLIRKATLADAEKLIALFLQMSPTYAMSLDTIQQRIKAFDTHNHQLLIAEDNNQLVGMIAFGFYEHFRLPGSCCHIDTLVIDKSCRGKGIGKKLIQEAENYAAKRGSITVELITANYRRTVSVPST
jgi:ribosomal protein S18 acetylase RimI-like enzyme